MAKINLADLTSGHGQISTINANNALIEAAINDQVAFRDIPTGEAAPMLDDLDMNAKSILNLPTPSQDAEAATKGYVDALFTPNVTAITTTTETQTATSLQTLFTLAGITYTPGANNIDVYVNGVHQNAGAYSETSTTEITFGTGLTTGDSVFFKVNQRTVDATVPLASNVTYSPSGTGAVDSDVQTKLRETVSVKDFGAAGDGDGAGGGTDDTVAIEACWDAVVAAGGGTIEFPFGTYRMDTLLSKTVTVPMRIIGNNSLIDNTNGAAGAIHLTGTRSTAGTIDANLSQLDGTFDTSDIAFAEGDMYWLLSDNLEQPAANLTFDAVTAHTQITVTASASVFASGDVGKSIVETGTAACIKITEFNSGTEVVGYSNATALSGALAATNWDLGTLASMVRGTYVRSEFGTVQSISGATVTINNPILDDYTAAETNLYKITPCTVVFENLRVSCDATVQGIKITYGRNCRFDNVHQMGARNAGFVITDSMGTSINDCTSEDNWITGGGNQYGLIVDGAQDTKVNGGRFTSGRHGISIGGVHRVYNTKLTDVIIGSSRSSHYGLDNHSNGEYFSAHQCTIYNGVTMDSMNWEFVDCHIHVSDSSLTKAVSINLPDGGMRYARLINCHVQTGGSATISAAVEIVAAYIDASLDIFEISGGGIVCRTGSAFGVSGPPNYDASSVIKNVMLNDVRFLCKSTGIYNLASSGNSTKITHLKVSGYIECSGTSGNGINLQPGSSFHSETVHVLGSRIITTTATGSNITINHADKIIIANVEFDGNDLATLVTLVGTDVNVHDSTFANYTTSAGLAVTGIPHIHNNDHAESAGVPNIVDAHPIAVRFPESRRFVGGAAAPTTLTWMQGDTVWDSTPSAGGTMGWVCTESGTFGAATDATGDTDGSTAVITGMTDTSDFAVGQYVDTSNGFASNGPHRVLEITSTTMTLDSNSDSSESNITVDTSDPVFKTFGAITA